MEEKIEELEKLLMNECKKYENDCTKCPYMKECNEYSRLDLCIKMNLIEKVGNLKVYTKHLQNTIEVCFYSGIDLVASETYFNMTEENAIVDLFSKKLDTYTEDLLWINYLTVGLEKLTDNTYRIGSMDWFCRIDDTKYFKHFHKSEDEFAIGKNGEKIIDR